MTDQPVESPCENKLTTFMTNSLALYRDGFRSMVLGRTLWKIIIIKLLIMFGVLKLFFFPNYLNSTYETEAEKAAHVLGEITGPIHSGTAHIK